MHKSKSGRSLFVVAVLLVSCSGTQAATLSAGTYNMFIKTWANSTTALKSGFSYGSACTSPFCGLTDNGALVRGLGSSIGGDGYAGIINITVNGSGDFGVNSFSMDAYPSVGGDLTTWANSVAGMGGNIDAGGNITFNLTGRVGVMNFFPAFDNGGLGTAFYADNAAGIPGYTGTGLNVPFTTGTSCNLNNVTGATDTCLTGQGLDNSGNAVLVSLGNVGSDWGYFETTSFAEIFSVHIQAVPVPASAWLFSSGILGLFGVARRKHPKKYNNL
ncbi:hypothetical protein SCD_n01308 [Sulfuricella denitrificans skB26]|uniref:PEP-CTERM protein-sorting domain-containing protein n=1 Tax=Sulfuricella denitrificans (strain DSM 22764 / NBRC 105220 / skB26) TaxID=1163617 RepID=S6AA28_SULDS|nr:VPLPA-CTERM sorting domain-containing protein [Sulfuricella denitrificans]BAN35135.1 hypothetical protein SCD_n01308 [Sulfuricella denitrificans skB26]